MICYLTPSIAHKITVKPFYQKNILWLSQKEAESEIFGRNIIYICGTYNKKILLMNKI